MNDVLAEEKVRYVDAFGENAIENQHLCLWPKRYPAHIAVFEVVEDGNTVALEDRHVAVEIFALERVRHDRLVLHTDQVSEAFSAQRADGSFELPRCRI